MERTNLLLTVALTFPAAGWWVTDLEGVLSTLLAAADAFLGFLLGDRRALPWAGVAGSSRGQCA